VLKHLFDSQGRPVAYIHEGDKVFLYDGRFLGWLTGGEVRDGTYRGEVLGDRLLYREQQVGEVRPTGGVPFAPGMPYRPWGVAPSPLPDGFRDVDPPPTAG
jgi:hypothetical protein